MADNEKPVPTVSEPSSTVINEMPEEIAPTDSDQSSTVVDKMPESHVLVKVKGQDESEVLCRIKRSAKLKKFMNEYCEKRSIEMNTIQFILDEKLLNKEKTAEEVGLEDGDEIDAMLHMNGG